MIYIPLSKYIQGFPPLPCIKFNVQVQFRQLVWWWFSVRLFFHLLPTSPLQLSGVSM